MMMLFALLMALQGLLIGIDSVLWHRAAMPDYAAYGIYYAQIRMRAYEIELVVSIVMISAGVLFLLADLVKKGGLRKSDVPDADMPRGRYNISASIVEGVCKAGSIKRETQKAFPFDFTYPPWLSGRQEPYPAFPDIFCLWHALPLPLFPALSPQNRHY